MRLRPMLAALIAAPLMLAGCGSEAEKAVEDSLNVEEGSNAQVVETEERDLIHEDIERLKDPKTGEVVSEEVETTPVTVKEQTAVEENIEVESGKTTKTSKGEVSPNSVEDDED